MTRKTTARQRSYSALLSVLLTVLAALAWFIPSESGGELLFGRYGAAHLLAATLLTVFAIVAISFAFIVRSRIGRFRLTAVVIASTGTWTVAKALAWLTDWTRPNPFYIPGDATTKHPDTRVWYVRPPNLYWKGKSPDDFVKSGPYEQEVVYRTDSDGFRNHREVSSADVVFVGDSFTEAGNVNDEQTFAARTGRILDRSTAKYAIAGYGPLEEVAALELLALKKQPKQIVWQLFEGNDLADVVSYVYWEQLGGRKTTGGSALNRWERGCDRWQRTSPFIQLMKLAEGRQPKLQNVVEGTFRVAGNQTVPMHFEIIPNPHTDPAYHPMRLQKTREALLHGQSLCRQHTIDLLIVVLPIKLRVYQDSVQFPAGQKPLPALREQSDFSQAMAAICHEAGIEFLDPTRAFRQAAARGEVFYFAYDMHLTPAGHLRLAELIAARIR